jgi:hypothetical protein
VPPEALAALRCELDALRFARDEPSAEQLADLIARARALARRTPNGR